MREPELPDAKQYSDSALTVAPANQAQKGRSFLLTVRSFFAYGWSLLLTVNLVWSYLLTDENYVWSLLLTVANRFCRFYLRLPRPEIWFCLFCYTPPGREVCYSYNKKTSVFSAIHLQVGKCTTLIALQLQHCINLVSVLVAQEFKTVLARNCKEGSTLLSPIMFPEIKGPCCSTANETEPQKVYPKSFREPLPLTPNPPPRRNQAL